MLHRSKTTLDDVDDGTCWRTTAVAPAGLAQVEDIDKALYGGRPQVIEIREAKPTEIYHCRACNRNFKRGDNFRRHLQSKLHQRRQRAMVLAMKEEEAESPEIAQEPEDN